MTWQLEILRKWLDWKLHTADNLKTNNYYLETFSNSWSYSLLPFLPNRCNHWCSISTLLKQPQLISYSPNTTFPMQPVWSALFSLVWYPFQVGRKPRLCDWSFDLFKNMLNIENMDSYSLNFENIKKHGHVFENMTLTALRLSKTLNRLSKLSLLSLLFISGTSEICLKLSAFFQDYFKCLWCVFELSLSYAL